MLNLTPATFEDFAAEAQRGNVVPVVRSVLADLQTPVGAFLRIAGDAPYAFLLESIAGGEHVARYSFIGANPWMVVRANGAQTTIEQDGRREVRNQKGSEFLRQHFSDQKLAERPGLAPLAGGAVGYLAYDAARWFEPVLAANSHESPVNNAVWMFFRNIVAFDRVRQQMEITSVVFVDEAAGDKQSLLKLYERAIAETAEIEGQLKAEFPGSAEPRSCDQSHVGVESNWSRKDFEAAVDQVKDYIAAGDCYQAVIAQQFAKPTCASALAIYRALRATNPSPYMYFLRMGDETIIGASPEMLVHCSHRTLEYRPIAGTRRRGDTETDDLKLGEEMRTDEKEVAEHIMLVDLGRNDLGRVSEYGSVKVQQLMAIERYSHVQHLVSSVGSTLRKDLDRFDALAACFPAGTVTGAPKIRAMQIIEELEPAPRGVYAGAILYVDYAENLDSCIAIRTIELRDGVATVQAGAGIVADSVASEEFQECVNKARAMFSAIELAEKGL
ncbi:MAG: anthranilate synthase component I family protein [Pyrinomonadaceae bacterium]